MQQQQQQTGTWFFAYSLYQILTHVWKGWILLIIRDHGLQLNRGQGQGSIANGQRIDVLLRHKHCHDCRLASDGYCTCEAKDFQSQVRLLSFTLQSSEGIKLSTTVGSVIRLKTEPSDHHCINTPPCSPPSTIEHSRDAALEWRSTPQIGT